MILGGGRWPPCANVAPNWLVPEGRMRRGGGADGLSGDKSDVRAPVRCGCVHASLRDARRSCTGGFRGPRPPAITMEPSGL